MLRLSGVLPAMLLAFTWPAGIAAGDEPRPRLAVAPLEVYGSFPEKEQAGVALQDYLLGQVSGERYRILERAALASILRERRFVMERVQRLDQDVLKGLREVVDLLLVGSVSKIEDEYRVSLRLVRVADGQVSRQASGGAPSFRELRPKLEGLVGELGLREPGRSVGEERGPGLSLGWEYLGQNGAGHHEFRAPRDGSVMIWVPPGEFTMGIADATAEHRRWQAREKARLELGWFETQAPAHRVRLSGYYIAKHEVTREQYRRFLIANPEWQKVRVRADLAGGSYLEDWQGNEFAAGSGRHPVVWVSWHAAAAYCAWAGLVVPTEAQWERAARGTDGRDFPWGNDLADLGRRMNFADRRLADSRRYKDLKGIRDDDADRAADDGATETAPAGSYPAGASPCGALDMAGNAGEWCRDWYYAGFYDSPPSGGWKDPECREPPGGSTFRALRGGSWTDPAAFCRAASRIGSRPAGCYDVLGFRPAR